MLVGGRGPMMVIAFRFEEAMPSLEDLRDRFQQQLGSRLSRAIDRVELWPDHLALVTSQDLIALTYVGKVCSELGGARVHPATGEHLATSLPGWVQTAWPEHRMLARLRVRFGRLSL